MRKRVLFASLFAAVMAFSAASYAEIPVSGNVEFYGAADSNEGDIYRKWIKTDVIFNQAFDTTSIYVDIRAEKDTARSSEAELLPYTNNSTNADSVLAKEGVKNAQERVYLKEAYITQDVNLSDSLGFFDSFNFKVGKMIHTWGSSDEAKPCDILNAQDYSWFIIPKLQERKIAAWSADAALYITPDFFLEGVVIPEFVASDVNSASFQQKKVSTLTTTLDTFNGKILDPVEPDNTMKQASYAGRIGASLLQIDMHFNYFYGWDHIPVFEAANVNAANVSSNPATQELLVTGKVLDIKPVYKKLEMYGFDFQRALFSGISVRGEAAFFNKGKHFQYMTSPVTDKGHLMTLATKYGLDITNPADQAKLGVLSVPFLEDIANGGTGWVEKKSTEFTIGIDDLDLFGIENLYCNLQFNEIYILDYDKYITDAQQTRNFIGKLEYKFMRDKARLFAQGTYNFNEKDFFTQYEVGYKPTDAYELMVGYVEFKSDKGKEMKGNFGQFNDKDYVYVSGKVTF